MATKMKKSSNKVNNVTNKQQEIVQAKVSKAVNTTASTTRIFKNPEFGSIRVIEENGKYLFCGLDIATALGYAKPRNAINSHCRYALKRGVPHPQNPECNIDMTFIPEGDLYRLIVHSKLPSAERFERWVFDEVLPTIRKTGGYVDENRSDLFLDTYLPFADDTTRTLFKSTLDVINSQNEMIRQKNQEISEKTEQIDYQTNVIHGLTKDIPTADMRHILNRILRNNHGKFERRWMVLYREFDNIYKFDTRARYENYMISGKKPKVKNRLDYIDKVLNMLPQLFDVATKLFESDVNELVQQMYDVRKEDDEDAWMDEL